MTTTTPTHPPTVANAGDASSAAPRNGDAPNERIAKLRKLREPFPPGQIGKLPKGGMTLDFVGHAHVTARLLDSDPEWNWEPLAYGQDGLPMLDEYGGLWIRLTVCGVTRLGYGDASGKKGPNAVKEAIGDALRNAGMRFGVALELWAKGGLGDPGSIHDEPDPQLAAEIAAADEARTELLAKTEPYGWTPQRLMDRFATDYKRSLRNTRDVSLIRGFGAALVGEAAAAKRSGQSSGPAETSEPANAPEGPITQRQLEALCAALSNLGVKGHDATVQWCTEALGYEVTSKKNLTSSEASTLIDKAVAIEKQQGKDADGASN